MYNIYRFEWSNHQEQNLFLTQGTNESNSEFICHVSGVKVKYASPDNFLRRMNSWSSNSSQGSFKDHFENSSVLKENHSQPSEGGRAQRYYFHMQADNLKQVSSHNNDRTNQTLIEQHEIHNLYRETSDKPKKTVFQRLLSFLIRFFMPCIKVKT